MANLHDNLKINMAAIVNKGYFNVKNACLSAELKNIQSQFCDKIRKIVALHCVVSGVAKQNMSPQYLCWKKPLKMANDIEGMELCM